MPGTYSQLLFHIVTSTRGRTPWISSAVAERLYPYIGGIVRAEKGILYEIGGAEDHVHIYLRWRPDGAVSDLMRKVKAGSSKWMHETYPAVGRAERGLHQRRDFGSTVCRAKPDMRAVEAAA